MSVGAENPKVVKKLAKAAAKAAKKQPAGSATAVHLGNGESPAERSAAAAERQVALQRWRVALAIIAALIGAATLFVMLTRG